MRLATLLFLSIFLLASCGNSDDEVEKEGNCMTATINGSDFTAESTVGVFNIITIEYENLGDQETKLLTITGTVPDLSAETKTITLTFACSEFTSDLDYVDSDSDCGIGMNYQITNFTDPNASLFVDASTGAINIEEVSDDHIRGTFTFSGEDQNGTSYTIANGFFDTSIQ